MTMPVPDHPVHPLGSQARVLLASVFGPYAQDDQYGSRLINPMELFHNQVTRVQEAFSFRSFPSLVGADADPSQPEGPLHAAGLPVGGAVRRGDQDAASTTSSGSARSSPTCSRCGGCAG